MFDRSLVWLSAGVVAAGVSMAMVGGAGIAAADDGRRPKVMPGHRRNPRIRQERRPDSEKQGSKPVTKNGTTTGTSSQARRDPSTAEATVDGA